MFRWQHWQLTAHVRLLRAICCGSGCPTSFNLRQCDTNHDLSSQPWSIGYMQEVLAKLLIWGKRISLSIQQLYFIAVSSLEGHTLGCIKSRLACRSRDVVIPLYSSLVRPHLQCRVQLSPQHKQDVDLLEWVQRPRKWSEGCSICPMKTGWEIWSCLVWRREGFGERCYSGLSVSDGISQESWRWVFYKGL